MDVLGAKELVRQGIVFGTDLLEQSSQGLSSHPHQEMPQQEEEALSSARSREEPKDYKKISTGLEFSRFWGWRGSKWVFFSDPCPADSTV